MRRPTTPPRRYGFTMVELLVVILVLVILLGLLMPAVMRAVSTAKDASVAAEINQMAQALADFKNRYGTYPPSRILVSETGNFSTSSTSGLGNLSNWAGCPLLVSRSISALRRIFPRMQISTTGPVAGIPGGFYDFNGNTTNDGAYLMEGPDCLVFFLGGIPQQTGTGTGTPTGWAVTGFGTNPFNPMASSIRPPTPGAWPYSQNRTPLLFEFNNGRLDDNLPLSSEGTGGLTPNGIPEYYDSLTSHTRGSLDGFFAYFSAYEGVGYDPGDCDGAIQEQDDEGNPESGAFMTNNIGTPIAASPMGRPDFISSPPPNPYVNDTPIPQTSTGAADSSSAASYRPRAYQNPQTFQIISPGRDRNWGIGGQYVTNVPSGRLPLVVSGASGGLQSYSATTTATGITNMSANVRTRELDNITNFSGGRLE